MKTWHLTVTVFHPQIDSQLPKSLNSKMVKRGKRVLVLESSRTFKIAVQAKGRRGMHRLVKIFAESVYDPGVYKRTVQYTYEITKVDLP